MTRTRDDSAGEPAPENRGWPSLSPETADRIDRVFADGYATQSEHDCPPFLRLLDVGVVSPDPLLSRVTMERIQRAAPVATHADGAGFAAEAQLSTKDQAALASWLDTGGRLSDVSAGTRARASAISNMASVITAGDAKPTPGLAARTLQRVEAAEQTQRESMRFENARAKRSFRPTDLIAAAAVVLLAASVAMPIMGTMREHSMSAACESNMIAAALGMGSYANENTDTLPMVTAGFDSTWLDVGSRPERSNSANLFNLVRTGHNSVADLACPGNPEARTELPGPDATDWLGHPEVSYSYQIMDHARRIGTRTSDQRVPVVLADRSPVILRVVARQPIDPDAGSPNHAGRSQHVLRTDGSTGVLTSAVDEAGDNIWLPRQVETAVWQARSMLGLIEGHEAPSGNDDVFLGP